MREILPIDGINSTEYMSMHSTATKELILDIRQQKQTASRPKPSTYLIDRSTILSSESRCKLLDKAAELVDENITGRSDMCWQFAQLLSNALNFLNCPAKVVIGTAMYLDSKGRKVYQWEHAWVRSGKEVIDANVDILIENPMVPKHISIAPYWGPINLTPKDRTLKPNNALTLPFDSDVESLWWPEYRDWISLQSFQTKEI